MPITLPYCIEYCTSEQRCNHCQEPFPENSIYIGIMQQSMTNDCMEPQWYDMDSFFQIRRPVSVDLIDGFANLRYHHQIEIQRKLGVDAIELQEVELQNKDFFVIYDKLKHLNNYELVHVLEKNNQFVPKRFVEILNHLSDVICFGALAPCPVCKDGKFVLHGFVYRCTGYVSAWSTCINSVKEPQRLPVKLPPNLKEIFKDNLKVRTRTLCDSIEFNAADFELHTKQPLFNMEFFIVGETKPPRKDIEYKIQAMGGKIASKIHSTLAAVISNVDAVKHVFMEGIHVVSDDFLDQVMDSDPIEVIVKNNIRVGDVYDRFPERRPTTYTDRSKPYFMFGQTTAVTSHEGKVYCSNGVRYEAMLNFVDISSNKNTYFHLQLLDMLHVRSTTGRIGTAVNHGSTQQSYTNLTQAQAEFKKIYLEKTGNEFGAKNFVKNPGFYNLVNIDNETLSKVCRNTPPTKLSKPLYELMELLYNDDKVFKSALVSYCFDLDGMPLGKLNKLQIQAALNVLDEISSVQNSGNANQVVAASNKFYSYFPHNFGHQQPPVLNTNELIQDKRAMLQNLLQKDPKYEFLTSTKNEETNLLDFCYEHLQESADITILDKSSPMYRPIYDYVLNTQLHGQSCYKLLDVDEIFKVERYEETNRYAPYEDNFNRQLLFHGAPIRNLVGILTNGLKVSNSGDGIYFYDSVLKSAEYCQSGNSRFGLVLLCEVAAGLTGSRCTLDGFQLNKHCESVQVLGQYYPHPLHIRKDGLKIPNGKLIRRKENAGVTFNEFVVSDESRLKVRYIVKLKFDQDWIHLILHGSLSHPYVYESLERYHNELFNLSLQNPQP